MERIFAAPFGGTPSGCEVDGAATFRCLEPMFGGIVQAVVGLAGVALFIMLVVGGFNMLVSGGDAKKLDSAKGTITNAVIGLVVIVAAYLILRTIGVITGTENIITTFKINTK